MINSQTTDRSTLFQFLWMFLVLAVGAVITGYLYYQNYQQRFRKDVESQLSAIVELKVGELERWRKDRLDHGAIISRVEAVSSFVRKGFIDGSDPEARRQLHGILNNYSGSFHYEQIRLLDINGATLMSLPSGSPAVSVAVREQIANVVRSKRVTMIDFYRNDHDKRVYLTMLIPVRSDLDENRVIGLIALRINPETYLYPLIRFWPTSARTAETLLVRRDGNDALFLNELKYSKNSALNLRASLNNVNQPAVKAVMGTEGVVEGTDYRGVPVVAYLKSVPGTPWHLVARIDTSEVYAPLKERLRWIVVAAALLLCSAGAGLGMLWSQQRVHFYRAKYRIEQERAWLQGVIERSLNEIYVFDPQSLRFTFVNNGALLNIGYSMEEMKDLTPVDIKPEYTQESFLSTVQPLLEGQQERLVFETFHRRKDASTYPVEVSLQLVDTPDGNVFLAVINDITVRKQADDEIRQKNAELERFTYTVSHDLKSPLITIKSFSGSIKRDLASDRHDRIAMDLERIGTAADKMAALLDDLLELSRIGRIVNAPEPVALADIVDDVLLQLDGLLKANHVNVEIQPGLPIVMCDRQRLGEVLQNLLENAVKYMGNQPRPQILFGMRSEYDKNIFFVEDNGPGIDKKYHQNIFGLFNKLDAKSGGTGIGLALAKRIIEVHGGEIWVESEGIGKGSTFCFTLAQQQ
jgi:PAS domain S-box-containing protein